MAAGHRMQPAQHAFRACLVLRQRRHTEVSQRLVDELAVLSRDQLLDQVWGANVYVEDRTIDVHIRRLRKALAPYGFDRFIQTVRGTGYRFSVKAAKAS